MSVKKILKITLVGLLVLIAVVAIAVAVVINMVFNSEKLTAYVQEHAGEYVTCPMDIDQVELTFFSTFPDFCIHVSKIALVNPMEGATNDTLLYVNDLYAQINVMDYLDHEKISITAFNLQQGNVNIYLNEEGKTNFDVCPMLMDDSEATADTTASVIDKIKLEGISVSDFSASFLDRKHEIEARVGGLSAVLETDAELLQLKGNANLSVDAEEIFYSDPLNFGQIYDFHFDNCQLWSDGTNATLKLEQLKAATQEYLLSGDVAMMASIWNFSLHDIDLAWQDGKPTVEVLTQLDSASLTVGEEDLTYVTVGKAEIDAPVESNDSLWNVKVNTRLEHLNVAMDSEGTLVDNSLFTTTFQTSTNTSFNNFRVWDMVTSLGKVTLLGKANFNMADSANMKGDVDLQLKDITLPELLAMVPAKYLEALEGMDIDASLKKTHVDADFALRNNVFQLNHVKASGSVADLNYADVSKMGVAADNLDYVLKYPNNLKRPYADIAVAGGRVEASMNDSLQVKIEKPSIVAKADFENYGNRIKLQTQTELTGLEMLMVDAMKGKTGAVKVRFDAMYDDRKEDVLEMLQPDIDAKLSQARFDIDGVEYPIEVPAVDFNFSNNLLNVNHSELVIGNSQLSLKGVLNNLADYLADKAMLQGSFRLGGSVIDADQLLSVVSGFGADSTEVADASVAAVDSIAETTTSVADAEPFMVPLGVDIVLNTHVDKVLFNAHSFNDVAGTITCRDGVMVLEEMGFTSDAANMQLTALYKSPRKNNLFVGWNFHLLNIDIAEMISIVPEIDSIAPMVKSFAGKAEFHLAGETNLFADYSPKMSTLKAVAAIEGKDLTVLDNETFQTIKKYLFKDCTTNKIDSMSVELSVARKKMSLYPMLVSWDRYQAVLSGNHSVVNNMPFNYHISITKCPVVGGHLGLDVSGNMEDLDNISFKLGNCKYANLYRPEKRNVTQQQTLELKELISSSLKKTVK